MPRPIPPPPPQPTEHETRAAVRLVWLLAVLGLGLFLGYTRLYGVRGFPVDYGRNSTPAWILWKIDRLKEKKLRAHEGGRVAWLVGSSILRESFDEAAVNAELARRQSEWRVAKFGLDRGASGLASGVLERLPLREGDLVLHSVDMENFLKDWLKETGVPYWQVMMLLPSERWWDIQEWSLQQKLEVAVALPRDFWRFHEDGMEGWEQWLEAPRDGVPNKRKRHYTLTFHTREVRATWNQALPLDERHPSYLAPQDVDLSEGQFNLQGLARIRALCEERGARLAILDIPPRRTFTEHLMAPEVRLQWESWRDAQPELARFPQIPDNGYYDMKHPNFRGRAILSASLVGWLDRQSACEAANGGDATWSCSSWEPSSVDVPTSSPAGG